MIAYLPFGDWSYDGHGRCDYVPVAITSFEQISEAQNRIREKYDKYFFSDFANEAWEPYFSEDVWNALLENEMPIELLKEYEENNSWDDINSLDDLRAYLKEDPRPCLSIGFVEQAFIWLLNKFGAKITILPDKNLIPCITMYTCPGFENVGYGCWDD